MQNQQGGDQVRLAICFLTFSICLGAQDFFARGEVLTWNSANFAFDPTLSPNGKCLAFYEYDRQLQGVIGVSLMTPNHLEPKRVWDNKQVPIESIQCLDNGLLLLQKDTLYRFDLSTGEFSVILAPGFQTNMGRVTRISYIVSDDLDPQKLYVVGKIGSTIGLFRLTEPRTLNVVLTSTQIEFPNFSWPHISGDQMVLRALLQEDVFAAQVNLQTGSVTQLFTPIKTAGGRYYKGIPSNPWSSGNLTVVTTVENPAPPMASMYGYKSHIFLTKRGEPLPSDLFSEGGPEEIGSIPENINHVRFSPSVNWGMTGATLYSGPDSWILLETGVVFVTKGDRVPGGSIVEQIGGISSSRNGFVVIIHRKKTDGSSDSGFWFEPTKPYVAPSERPPTPTFSAETITNAASFVPGPIAPRTWTSIFGEHLISEKYAWRLHVNNVELPLKNISLETSNQINFLTPDTLGPEAKIAIVHFDADGFEDVRTEVTVPVALNSPGLFQAPDENNRLEVIVTNNSPFYVVTKERPAEQSAPAAINLWGTGFTADTSIEVTLTDKSAEVLWIGEVMPGLTQVNVLLPPGLFGTVLGEARIGDTVFPLRFYVEEAE